MSCGLTHFDFQSFRITLPAALRKFGLQVRNGRQRRIPFAGLVFGIRFPVQCRVRLWSVLLRQFVEFVFCLLIFAIVQCFPSVVVEFLHPVDPLLFAIFSLLLSVTAVDSGACSARKKIAANAACRPCAHTGVANSPATSAATVTLRIPDPIPMPLLIPCSSLSLSNHFVQARFFSHRFPLAIPAALPAPLTKFLVPQSVFELMRTALV